MAQHVCPWWFGYWLASPLRRLAFSPREILGPYVSEGMKVLEPGPGMGFFTLELARLVGPSGRLFAVDIQQKMLDGLSRRAEKAHLLDRIELRLSGTSELGVRDLKGTLDFVLAFAMVHEVPDPARFFKEVAAALRPGGRLLFSEPSGHVGEADFARSLELALAAGLRVEGRPAIRRTRSALLAKG